MLPFPILNQYGNIIPAKETLRDFGTNGGYLGLLSSKGNIYVSGNNAITSFGSTDKKMTLLGTNADDAWFSTTSESILIRSGTQWYQRGFIMNGTRPKIWYNLTSQFESLFTLSGTRNIKKVMIEPMIVVLMDDNKLYALGTTNNGVFGNGSLSSTLSSFTMIASDVNDFVLNYNGLVYTSRTGKLYCTGVDYNGSMLYSNRITFFELVNQSGTSFFTKLYIIGTQSGIFNILSFNTTDNKWYGTGTNTTALGGKLSYNWMLSQLTPSPETFVRSSISNANGNTNLSVSETDGRLYICGWDMFGMTGLGINDNTQTTTFTLLPETVPIVKVLSSPSASYYMTFNKELYGAGYGSGYNLPPTDGQFSKFKKLELPF